jgi:hypothetical protein
MTLKIKPYLIGLVLCFIFLNSEFAWAEVMEDNSSVQKINHPAAESDGLTRIDADGNYIYDVQNPLRNQSTHLRIGSVSNPEVSVEVTQYNTGNVSVIQFDDIYEGASKLSIGFDYEYFLSSTGGRWGLQSGLAFQYAEGQGRLAVDPSVKSIEKFSFITMPIYLGAVYRFEYYDRQLFSPYVSGGAVYTVLAEKRDDSSAIKGIGAVGAYGSGGALLNLSALDRDLAGEFKTEYDISNVWLNLELRTVQVESEAFSYSNNFIQGGLSFDF